MRIAIVPVAGAFAACLISACAGPVPNDDAPTGKSESTIVGGTTTPHAEIANIEGNGIGNGVLVAPTLVLTSLDYLAVSVVSTPTLDCQNITAGAVRQITKQPVQLNINFGDTTVHATQYITLGTLNFCTGNLAFVVLDTPITNIPTPKILWDTIPQAGDNVTGCGWGFTDIKCASAPDVQCSTGGVEVSNGGLFAPENLTVPPGQGIANIQACNDLGGALFDGSGNLAGIITDNVIQPDKSKVFTVLTPCATCIDSHSNYVVLSAFKDFVAQAFASQGLAPWRAGHPKPADVGASCTDQLDCNSQLCVSVGKSNYCSQYCDATACPGDSVCTSVGSRSVCLPKVTPHPASCAVSTQAVGSDEPSRGSRWLLIGLGIGVIGLIARSRRGALKS